MARSEAKDKPYMITGLLMICNFPTFVLFDSRAMHYFISMFHTKTLNHQIEPLENGLLISTPFGQVFLEE